MLYFTLLTSLRCYSLYCTVMYFAAHLFHSAVIFKSWPLNFHWWHFQSCLVQSHGICVPIVSTSSYTHLNFISIFISLPTSLSLFLSFLLFFDLSISFHLFLSLCICLYIYISFSLCLFLIFSHSYSLALSASLWFSLLLSSFLLVSIQESDPLHRQHEEGEECQYHKVTNSLLSLHFISSHLISY